MFPNGASFVVIFGVNAACGAVKRPVARGFRGVNQIAFATVSSRGTRFHPFVGIHAHHPAVAVGRDIGIAVKIVGHGKAFRQRGMIGHHIHIFQRLSFVAIGERRFQAIAGQQSLAFAVGILAEYLIVGAVFFGDKHNVLNVGKCIFSG